MTDQESLGVSYYVEKDRGFFLFLFMLSQYTVEKGKREDEQKVA